VEVRFQDGKLRCDRQRVASVASAASCSVVVWYFVTNEWRRSGIIAYNSSICASWTRTSQPLQALIVSSVGLVSPWRIDDTLCYQRPELRLTVDSYFLREYLYCHEN
jgi:hypothetical protein